MAKADLIAENANEDMRGIAPKETQTPDPSGFRRRRTLIQLKGHSF
jgi:hypothetical protein